MSALPTTRPTPRTRPRAALTLGLAAVVAVGVEALIAQAAVAAGAPPSYGPLMLPAHATLAVAGVVIGWFGWLAVHRRAADPRRTLRRLVPVVALASFVPDVLLLALRFIPGTNVPAVVALVLMHLVVLVCALPAYARASRHLAPR
jgi:hypothetical protein